MLGIILAGGTGSRLGPITRSISKQLLPIYDKPMIYYPLSLLMASGLREIAIITSPRDRKNFQDLLGDGSQWGINITYVVQEKPNGIPESFILCKNLINNDGCTLILGDNIFYGSGMGKKLAINNNNNGASIYGYYVGDVSSFGTFELNDQRISKLEEKPKIGGRGYAIPGIYHFDSKVSELSEEISHSKIGELEIIDLLRIYLNNGHLTYSILDRGTAWLDTGTIEDMSSASELIRVVQSRQGLLIGSPDEVAYRNHWIDSEKLNVLAEKFPKSLYGKALLSLIIDS